MVLTNMQFYKQMHWRILSSNVVSVKCCDHASGVDVFMRYMNKMNSFIDSFYLQEVEREISFRTESGLYYSYYKQLVQAPSLSQGLSLQRVHVQVKMFSKPGILLKKQQQSI